jgi:hypothetical protein
VGSGVGGAVDAGAAVGDTLALRQPASQAAKAPAPNLKKVRRDMVLLLVIGISW